MVGEHFGSWVGGGGVVLFKCFFFFPLRVDSSQKVSSACLNHFPGLRPCASRAQCLPSETWLCLRPDGLVQHLRESAVAPGACSTLAPPSTSSFPPPSYLSCKLNILHLFSLFIRLSSLAASHFEGPPAPMSLAPPLCSALLFVSFTLWPP